MKETRQNSNSRSFDVALSRDLNLFTVTMIGVGGMIGAGIFVLTGIAAGVAGPALILAFLLNGVVTSFTAMSYAELGSAFPEAGGGYLWVKEAMGGVQGFISGWMNWFAPAVAGALYALAFGRFASELLIMTGLPTFGLSVGMLSSIFMTLIIALFTYINFKGASETGTVGNIVTLTKIFILGLFVVFGIFAMGRTEAWHTRFTTGFMPNGILSVVVAMGLTFIAFEGYEIIAQSGEEVIDPKRNIPRAIFISIAISVAIYVLVGITSIGAVKPPEGLTSWQFLGEQREVAIVEVARQTFPYGIGAVVLLLSGLASTMSALNATTYSSSRVSFAMGRDHDLPSLFGRIHPRNRTPYWAVIFSGGLMIAIGWSLPIETVAAAADIMYLLLFMQVNLAVMVLRHRSPEMERGFRIPWFPAVPIIAIISNLGLALYLFTYSSLAWYAGIGWLVVGALAYYTYFSKIEAIEKPKEILHEEVLVSRDYSVLVPVATEEQARILGEVGAILAEANQGEVLALHVLQVPFQLSLGEGRYFLKEGRGHLEGVIQQAKRRGVPVHTIIRLSRKVAQAIRKTASENASDLIVLGWPGYTNTAGRLFGSVIDEIVEDPPADVALVRYRAKKAVKRVLVPVAGGPNSRRAVKMAVVMAAAEETPAAVDLIHVVPPGSKSSTRVRARQITSYAREGIEYPYISESIVEGANLVPAILEAAKPYDLIVMGASEEPIFRNILIGPMTEQIAKQADVTVIVVKRRSSRLQSFVRQTMLPPTEPVELPRIENGDEQP